MVKQVKRQPWLDHSGLGAPIKSAVVFFIGWLGYAVFSVYPGFVHEDLAEISMWASLGFHLGYDKHPPLLPWIVGVLGLVVPITWVTLAVIAAANLTLAAFAVWRIGVLTLGQDRAVIAVGLFCLSPYTTSQAIKLNHNSVLLSLWPLTVLAFLRLLQRPTASTGAVLGLVSALAVLAKYSSGLLLLSIAIAAILSERRRSIFLSPAPYFAVLVFTVLVAPHVDWMFTDNFMTVSHAIQSLAPKGHVPWKMLQANLTGALPMLLGTGFLVVWLRERSSTAPQAGPADLGLTTAVFIVGVTSYVVTIAIIMLLGLRASHTWTLQIFAFLPLLLASFVAPPNQRAKAVLRRVALSVVASLPLVGFAVQVVSLKINASRATDPQIEFAADGMAVWHREVGTPLVIVGGDHRYALAASLNIPDRPAAWSHYGQVWWVNDERIADHGLLAWCRIGDVACETNSQRWVELRQGWSCPLVRQRATWGVTGPAVRATLYVVPPATDEATPKDVKAPQNASRCSALEKHQDPKQVTALWPLL
jgi:Dolichyl-phosphate-mannose-protein mannosyltransferase